MTKDDFLIAVKLSTGIEIKLGHEYYLGNKIGVIKPVEFIIDGIMHEYSHFNHAVFKLQRSKSFLSFYQIMECVNDIREIIPNKTHHIGDFQVFRPNKYIKTVI